MGSKSKSKSKRKETTYMNSIYKILFAGLCILLFYPPYFRGLFFEREFIPTSILTGIIFILFLFYKRKTGEKIALSTPMDYAAAALVLVYLLTVFFAVNVRLALGEWLKYATFFMIFIMVSEIAREEKQIKTLLNVLVFSAVGVAIIGIGAAAGTFGYDGAFVFSRISSTLQYPNALASYLMAVFFINFSLMDTTANRWFKVFYGCTGYILLFTFIFTYSRGAWLLFPVMVLLLIAILLWRSKISFVLHLVSVIIPSGLLLKGFHSAINAQHESRVWLIFLTGVVISAGLHFAAGAFGRIYSISKKTISIAAISLLIIFVTVGLVFVNVSEPLVLKHEVNEEGSSKQVVRNINDINPDTDYVLSCDVSADTRQNASWIYNIRVVSYNSENKTEILADKSEKSLGNKKEEIQFRTPGDCEKLSILFRNFYSGTTAVFDNAVLYERDNPSMKNKLTLKYKFIPESIVTRFQDINLQTNSAFARITFYKDSLKIIKDYPILGTGGGGWVTLYPMYQSYLYWSTQAHSSIMQLWIEVGTIGFIVFILLMLSSIYSSYRIYRSDIKENMKTIYLCIAVSVFTLLVHSIIDFDFSLSSIYIFFWTCLALVNASARNDGIFKNIPVKKFKFGLIFALVFALAVSLLNISLFTGHVYASKGIAFIKNKDYEKAWDSFEKTIKFDPFNADYRLQLSKLQETYGLLNKDKQLLQDAHQSMEKALELKPYSAKIAALYGAHLVRSGYAEKGLEYFQKAVELEPMRPQNYVQKIDAYLAVAERYISKGDREKALNLLNKGYGVIDEIKQVNSESLKPITSEEHTDTLVQMLNKTMFYICNIDKKNVCKMAEKSTFIDYFNIDLNNNGVPDRWNIWNAEGGQVEVNIVEGQDEVSSIAKLTNIGNKYGLFYTNNISLKPDTSYRLVFKVKGNTSKFNVYVNSRQENNPVQGSLQNVKLNNEFGTYFLDFKTNGDIEENKQYIRFQHNGNDDGYVEIAEVVLYEIK